MAQEQDDSLQVLFVQAEVETGRLDDYISTSDPTFQSRLQGIIQILDRCHQLIDRLALFSPNESLDDVSTKDIQYLTIDYKLADALLKISNVDRKAQLTHTQGLYESFLHRLDTYRILSSGDEKLYRSFVEDRAAFKLDRTTDAGARRDAKVVRYRHEKGLEAKLQHLRQHPDALQQDDAALRSLYLADVDLSAHKTFQNLDMINQELTILALQPSVPAHSTNGEQDPREAGRKTGSEYSERLDPSLKDLYRNGKAGPILSPSGKPLQPFTLLNTRQRLQDGVFRPDHSLPTMTIDEYLDEEKRRGGMIEGGGEQSGRPIEPNEDDLDRADRETMKARDWDEFVEANPKGSGNTLNRG